MWKSILAGIAILTWLAITGVVTIGYYQMDRLNTELRAQIVLLQDVRNAESELRIVEARRCTEIYNVNRVCEKVVYEFATQLGLDVVSPSRILTAGIVERHKASGGMGGGD